ncbi:hypothetical protein DKX38_017823 [Salix brachista]|uniref:S-locus receptor kinase C-terminal domain-containing protein n=1 Tax=Salix brachista TaxID=2182728 RepID=A0A5N5KWC7_9ROSI|nr:hypothetical protein DKX38_017823 [Salix brachista]
MLWIKGTPFELIDECLAESSNLSDIIRCIHVALLCVQQCPEDRPNMSAVVLILGSEIPLPQPKQPGFFMGENPHEHRTSSNKHVTYSGDEVEESVSMGVVNGQEGLGFKGAGCDAVGGDDKEEQECKERGIEGIPGGSVIDGEASAGDTDDRGSNTEDGTTDADWMCDEG